MRSQLLLDAIADAENTTVDDAELTERILYQAQRYGVSPDEYVRRAQESGQLTAIFADVRRGKALASIVRQATATTVAGEAVDMDELFGRRAEAGAEDAEAGETEVTEPVAEPAEK